MYSGEFNRTVAHESVYSNFLLPRFGACLGLLSIGFHTTVTELIPEELEFTVSFFPDGNLEATRETTCGEIRYCFSCWVKNPVIVVKGFI